MGWFTKAGGVLGFGFGLGVAIYDNKDYRSRLPEKV